MAEENAGDADMGVAEQTGAAETPATDTATTSDAESRARRMGWRPKEEFHGDASRWKPAEDFIRDGENELPILRERNRALDRRLGATEKRLDEVSQAAQELVEFNRRSEERAYKRAKAELEAELAARAAAADVPGVVDVQKRIQELEPPKQPEPAKTQTQTIEPEVSAWIDQNTWFRADLELNAFATTAHGTLLKSKPHLSVAENLAEVRRMTMKAFPEKFDNPRRETPAVVAVPSAPAKSKGKSYADLPSDAKAACDRFVKTIPKFNREDYVKSYFAGEE